MTVGGGAQTNPSGRRGDYSMTTVDPADNKTFWHVNEYHPATAGASWLMSPRYDVTGGVGVGVGVGAEKLNLPMRVNHEAPAVAG